MSHYDRVKEEALQSGKTMEEFVEALRMASEFKLTHRDPVGHDDLRALADLNWLAFEIYGAMRLDNGA